MWQTFWPDVLVALIGAFLTVAIAVVGFGLDRAIKRTHALNMLIRELHHRRALNSRPARIANARDLDDFRWATASVVSMRDEIRRTRDLAAGRGGLQQTLADMIRACNRWLEESARDPDGYAVLLVRLQDELSTGVAALARRRPRVRVLEPGNGSF